MGWDTCSQAQHEQRQDERVALARQYETIERFEHERHTLQGGLTVAVRANETLRRHTDTLIQELSTTGAATDAALATAIRDVGARLLHARAQDLAMGGSAPIALCFSHLVSKSI